MNDVPLSTTINIDSDGNLKNSVIYLYYLPGQVGSIIKKKKNRNYSSYTCIYQYYIIFTVSINIKESVYTFFKSVFYKNTMSTKSSGKTLLLFTRVRVCVCVHMCEITIFKNDSTFKTRIPKKTYLRNVCYELINTASLGNSCYLDDFK